VFLLSDVSDQVKSLQEHLPKYLSSINQQISRLESEVGLFTKSVFQTDLQGKLQGQLSSSAKVLLEQLPDYVSKSFTILLLAPFFAFFMLLNGSNFIRSLLAMVPNNLFELVFNLQYQISSQVGGFIRARLIESIIVGVLIWGGLLVLDFPYALVLAIFAAILNIIPYLGPILGAAPAFVIAFSNGGDSSQMIWLVVIFAGVQAIDAAGFSSIPGRQNC
jgi:putative permease